MHACRLLSGPPFNIQRGGGAGVFVAGKLFISIGLGGALKISHFITCLYRTGLEVIYYLFQAESARNYLFQKNSSPPPGNQMVAPLCTRRALMGGSDPHFPRILEANPRFPHLFKILTFHIFFKILTFHLRKGSHT